MRQARWIVGVISATTLVLVGVSTGLSAAGAEEVPNPGYEPGEASVTLSSSGVGGDFGAMHEVTCRFNAQEPVRFPSRDRLQGVGIITGCFPTDPQVCRIETDLQIYNHIDRRWDLYANGPRNFPNPCQGGRSTAANNNCTASKKGHNYRTRTYMTIVEDGETDARADTSAVRQYHCL